MEQTLLSRISIHPHVGHGKPTIQNIRYLVGSMLEYPAGRDTVDELLKKFPDLERADILVCIAYATEILKYKDVKTIVAQ